MRLGYLDISALVGPQGIKIRIMFNVGGRMYSLYVHPHIVLPDGIRAITTERTLEGNIGSGIVIGGLAGRCDIEFCNVRTS